MEACDGWWAADRNRSCSRVAYPADAGWIESVCRLVEDQQFGVSKLKRSRDRTGRKFENRLFVTRMLQFVPERPEAAEAQDTCVVPGLWSHRDAPKYLHQRDKITRGRLEGVAGSSRTGSVRVDGC